MIKRSLLFLLIFFGSFHSFSQGTATGCLLSDNRVYTTAPILGMYDSGTYTELSSNYCSWIPSTGSNCKVCFNGIVNTLGVCLGAGASTASGYAGTFTMVECSLDGFTLPLITASGVFGFIMLRRRKRF